MNATQTTSNGPAAEQLDLVFFDRADVDLNEGLSLFSGLLTVTFKNAGIVIHMPGAEEPAEPDDLRAAAAQLASFAEAVDEHAEVEKVAAVIAAASSDGVLLGSNEYQRLARAVLGRYELKERSDG